VAVQVYTNPEPRSLQVERVAEGHLVFCAERSPFLRKCESNKMVGKVESGVGERATRIQVIHSRARGWQLTTCTATDHYSADDSPQRWATTNF
jgi:hypothetical protein